MYGYIYLVTNLVDGKKYLGKHKYNKPQIDENYFGSGIAFNSALKKYGKDNFERKILDPVNGVPTICDTEQQLNESEYYYSQYYDVVNSSDFYNLVDGGSGGNIWKYMTEEKKTEVKQKRAKTISENPLYGLKISEGKRNQSDEKKEITSNNISKALTGVKKSDEHCKNISKSRKINKVASGKDNPNYSKIYVFDGDKELHIYKEQLQQYIDLGYSIGRPNSVNERAGEAARGKKWYHNELKNIRIKEEDVDYYVSIGYIPGRSNKNR